MTKQERIRDQLYLGETNVAKIAKACKCSKAMVRRVRGEMVRVPDFSELPIVPRLSLFLELTAASMVPK